MSDPLDGTIADLASRHHGLVSAAMLREAGVNRRATAYRVETGRLFRVLPEVFLVGHYHWSPDALWSAGVLFAGSDGRLISRSGCESHGWLQPYTARITVTGGAGCKSRKAVVRWPGAAPKTVVHVRRWDSDRPPLLGPNGLPTLSADELILGVAADGTPKQLGAAVRAAEYARVVDDASLRSVLTQGRAGTAALRALLDRRVVGTTFSRTALEEQLRDLIAAAGLPTPLTNVNIPTNDPITNVDFYLAPLGLVIEADGPEHDLPAQRLRDQEHTLALEALGLHVLRFSYRQIEQHPEAVIRALIPWAKRAGDLAAYRAGPGRAGRR